MQRGGRWDNTDIKGATKARRLTSDKQYAEGGLKKEQSVFIFGKGEGLDWTGSRGRSGPFETTSGGAQKFRRNYKAPTVSELKGGKETHKTSPRRSSLECSEW